MQGPALALPVIHADESHPGGVSSSSAPYPSTSPSLSPTTTDPSPTPTTPAATPTSSNPTSTAWACVTSAQKGDCPFPGYAEVTGSTSDPYVDQNMWGPISGETQTLGANSPGDWQIVSNTPAGNTSVTTFPNTGKAFNEAPLSSYTDVVQSFAESMPHNAGTSAWNMTDDWFDNWKYELMIQSDFSNNGDCDTAATNVMFNGQAWHLCTFGNRAASGGAFAWKLSADEAHKTNESTGSYDVTAMVNWLVAHGYWTASPTITNLSYGWEICSTGGMPETFQVSRYTLTAN